MTFHQSRFSNSHPTTLFYLRSRSQPHPTPPSNYTNFTPSIISRLDQISTLGSYDSEAEELIGHSGCVNALDWNSDGTLLASGSDDRNIVIWRMGIDHSEHFKDNQIQSSASASASRTRSSRSDRWTELLEDDQIELDSDKDLEDDASHRPKIHMGVDTLIGTGHRANIFSVKFAPHTSTRLFSCAGDRQVRVFDLNAGFSSTRTLRSGSSHRVYSEDSNACVRVFKCHKGRAKRIETEYSPETFLTASEDGTVRQMDLRLKHDCDSSSCPPPLASFPFSLYSISVSKLSPWLFIVAGTSPYAYLQDRRMVSKVLKSEWGMNLDKDDVDGSLTKCVRRFGIPEEGFEESENENLFRDDDDEEDERNEEGEEEREKKRRKMENQRREKSQNAHVTAAKISRNVEEELILSYSSDAIYRFRLSDPPRKAQKPNLNFFSRLSSRQKERSSKERDFHPDPVSTELKILRNEIFKTLFPRSNINSSLSSQDLKSKLASISDLQKTVRRNDKAKTSRPSEQPQASTSTSSTFTVISDIHMKSKISLILCEALISLNQVPPEIIETRATLNPFDEQSETIKEILKILNEEMIHAFDWESRSQMDQILDRIWILAEVGVREGWKDLEFEDHQDLNQGPMQVDDPVEASNEIGNPNTLPDELSSSDEDREEEMSSTLDDTPTFRSQPSTSQSRAVGAVESSSPILPELEIETQDLESNDEDENESSDQIQDSDSGSESDPDGIFARNQQIRTIKDFYKKVPIIHPINKYQGHRNIETVKDVNFLGNQDQFIITGSDDGNFFIYQKFNSKLIGILEGDSSVVNVLQPHPNLPLIGISGIDDTPRIFGPIDPNAKKKMDRMKDKEEIVRRNLELNENSGNGQGLTTRRVIQFLQQHVRDDGEIGEGDECRIN